MGRDKLSTIRTRTGGGWIICIQTKNLRIHFSDYQRAILKVQNDAITLDIYGTMDGQGLLDNRVDMKKTIPSQSMIHGQVRDYFAAPRKREPSA